MTATLVATAPPPIAAAPPVALAAPPPAADPAPPSAARAAHPCAAETEELRRRGEHPVAAAEPAERLELAAQCASVLATPGALAHVPARAAACAHAPVGGGGDVEPDVAACGVAGLDRLDEADAGSHQQRLDRRDR